MKEEYKTIDGYDNYKVSNLGNVKNVKTGKILKPNVSKGYLNVNICKDGKFKIYGTHRLIALTFIDNPEDKPCVDHIDNNKENNHISNLRWATYRENSQNASISKRNTSGVKGVTFKKDHKKWCAFIRIDCINVHIGYYNTIEEAQEARINKANEVFGNFTNICEKA
jgi:hypothetical protein